MEKVKFILDNSLFAGAKRQAGEILAVLKRHALYLEPEQLHALGVNRQRFDAAIWPAVWEKTCEQFGLGDATDLKESELYDLRAVCLSASRYKFKPYAELYNSFLEAGGEGLRWSLKRVNSSFVYDPDFCEIFEFVGDEWRMKDTAENYIEDCCTYYVTQDAKAFFDWVEENKRDLKKYISNRFIAGQLACDLENNKTSDKIHFAQEYANIEF